jgi:hypothetical protein
MFLVVSAYSPFSGFLLSSSFYFTIATCNQFEEEKELFTILAAHAAS